ncbi:MAG: energy-coupling factor transporter ATPase [Oscillospiraceae bacterium]|jgi:ABC-type cobalt transport system, ATPase component|nr:energy-coupling factor transporter ATPase [Oscillospiraceae bacterium]
MSVLTVEELCHTYSAHTPFEKVAVEGVSLTIPAGQFVGLLGHTGSGKSTFIQHLNALLQPTSGRVLLDGEDIHKDKASRRDVKRKVGLVFQYPEYQLFEETVFADIAFGPKNMGIAKEEIDERVREAAGFVGVDESLFARSPLELSGGQKRRVAIAGVIAMRPGVLILDEPTAGLDPAGCRQIMDNICRYREQSGATVIIVSHNMDDAARLTERLIVFDHGHVAMDGTPEEVFSRPKELINIGLAVPQATSVAMALRERGMALPEAIYTHRQLLEAVKRAKGVGTC